MTGNTPLYLYIPEQIPYGKVRKQFIKDWFLANPDGILAVNCKYRPQLKNDPDLSRLLKDGFLVRQRIGDYTHKTTYLIRNHNDQ